MYDQTHAFGYLVFRNNLQQANNIFFEKKRKHNKHVQIYITICDTANKSVPPQS